MKIALAFFQRPQDGEMELYDYHITEACRHPKQPGGMRYYYQLEERRVMRVRPTHVIHYHGMEKQDGSFICLKYSAN